MCANLAGKCFLKGWLWAVFWFWAVEFFPLPSSFFLEVGAYSWRRRRGPLVFSLSSPPFFRGYPSVASTKVIVRKGKCKNPDKEAPCFFRHPTYFSPDGRAPLFSDKLRGLEIREHCCIPKRGGNTRRLKSPGGIFFMSVLYFSLRQPFYEGKNIILSSAFAFSLAPILLPIGFIFLSLSWHPSRPLPKPHADLSNDRLAKLS